jgi:nitronate monooxygenase
MIKNTALTRMLGIEYPIIMAPMFLVSNTQMIIEGLKCGISGAIPALNYKTDSELRKAINEIKNASDKPFGINLIVNKSNPRYKQQLRAIIDLQVAYVITSLGDPKEVIRQCHQHGIKVFCDVVDLKIAQKVEKLGADALIAVNSVAGGHAGPFTASELIPMLKKHSNLPIISAGGVATHQQAMDVLNLGADGLSIGTPFIATNECKVSDDYKKAILSFGASDIVTTNKMSGSPLNVINTPYVQEIGTKANWLELILNKNRRLKKYAKMLILKQGMNTMEKAAFSATYKNVWVAGPGIEFIHEIKTVKEVVNSLMQYSSLLK